MKALILAAGKGLRMRPLTLERPKALIELSGRPFIEYVIESLKLSGVNEIGMIVGYKKEMIKEFYSEKGEKIHFIDQDEQLGTGHAVMLSEEWIKNENFIVLMGDNLYSEKEIKKINKQDGYAYIFGMESRHPERYGVLIENNGLLEKIIEKPKQFISDLVNIGLYKFTSEIFAKLKEVKKSERGEIELVDALSLLALEKKVKMLKVEGYWKEMSTFDDLRRTEEFIRSHNLGRNAFKGGPTIS